MATEAVTTLKVNTGDSEKTIKQLKEEIKNLKKSLEEATIGSDAFEQAQKDLTNVQNELKTALNSTKQTVQDAEGSYNALSKQMSELKKEWKATNDEAKRNQLGEQIDKINNELKELDATIGNHQRNVGNYKQDIIDAFDEIGVETVNYADRWREVQQATEQTRARFEAVQKTASGLASGFSALQGVMALTGIENENFEKTMIKVQSAMAIAQGVGGMKDLIEGFSQAKVAFQSATMGVKAFTTGLSGMKKAMLGTGIGALVVGVGLLIQHWDKLTKYLSTSDKEIKNVTQSVADLKEEMKVKDGDFEYLMRLREIAGATREEILQMRIENAKTDYDKYVSTAVDKIADANKKLKQYGRDSEEYKEAKKEADEANNLVREALLKLKNLELDLKELKKNIAKEQADALKEQRTVAQERTELVKTTIKEIEYLNMSAMNKELEDLKKIYEEKYAIVKGNEEAINKLKQWYSAETFKIEEKYRKQELEQNKQVVQEINKIDEDRIKKSYNTDISNSQSYTSTREEQVNSYYDDVIGKYEDEKLVQIELEIQKTLLLQKIQEDGYNTQIALIQEVLSNSILSAESREEYELQLIELQQERANKTKENNATIALLNKQLVEEQIAQNKQLKQNIINTYTSSLSAVQNILGALSDGIDTTNREGFEKNKKLQVANATIGMLVGITNALSGAFTTKSGPWDLILAGIQASAIATSGAIQIANINKQRFDGSGGDSANVSVTPNINLSDSMPIQYHRELLTDSETDEMNKSNRVYVLESDITDTQENVRIKEANATF